jgi:DNA repair exonuclease SbcCD ATPase subunit
MKNIYLICFLQMSIQVYIQGFKGISEKEIEVNQGSVTLLSGSSGAGKSTVMQAIYWCLYGSLRNVRKFGTKSGKCMVQVTINDVSIKRSKSPEELKYKDDSITLDGEEAQQKIIQLFGTKNVWLCTNYLSQGERNLFLTMSPHERLDILNEISFHQEDPGAIMDKIETKLQAVQKRFEQQNLLFTTSLESFQKRFTEANVKKSDIIDYLEPIPIQPLQQQLIQAEKNNVLYTNLVDQKNKLLNSIDHSFVDKIQVTLDQISSLEYMVPQKKKLMELKNSLGPYNFSSHLTPLPLDHDLLHQVKTKEKFMAQQQKICSQLNIPIDGIQKALEKRKLVLQVQPMLQTLYKIQEVEEELEGLQNISSPPVVYSKEEIGEKEKEICAKKDTLLCPHCSKGVKYIQNKLVTSYYLSPEEEKLTKTCIEESRKYHVIQSKIQECQKQLEHLHSLVPSSTDDILHLPKLDKNMMTRVEGEVKQLSSVIDEPFCPSSFTSEELIQCDKLYQWNEKKKEIDLIEDDGVELKVVQDGIRVLKTNVAEMQKKKMRLEMVQQELDHLENKLLHMSLVDTKSIDQQIKDVQEENEKRIHLNQLSDIAKKLFAEKQELVVKRKELVQLSSQVSTLSQLKEVANEVEHDALETILETIHNEMNECLSLLFDDPIKVELSTVKVMQKKVKPSINLKIFYKGYEIDGINSLSGGEADRVSLALTLALSKFSTFPLVMLDEFASGLDLISKERAVHALNSNDAQKTYLCISHDTVQGIYDDVITI